MPNETDEKTPPASPKGPSEDEVRSWVSDELRKVLGGGNSGTRERPPDLRTDKQLEAYVNRLVREGVAEIRRAEEAEGKTPPDPTPDETHEPEGEPEETPPPWQERLRKFLWGPS